jgi:hypothetical protein
MTAQKDQGYRERNLLVAALGKLATRAGGKCWVDRLSAGAAEQATLHTVYITFPEVGQLSWHILDSELAMFSDWADSCGDAWDMHTTAEKYDRLSRLSPAKLN